MLEDVDVKTFGTAIISSDSVPIIGQGKIVWWVGRFSGATNCCYGFYGAHALELEKTRRVPLLKVIVIYVYLFLGHLMRCQYHEARP